MIYTRDVKDKIPCEIITWYVLPVIRKELAVLLVKNHRMSQKEAASLLGVTDAAISQYLSKKRGNAIFCIENKDVFEQSAQRIVNGASAKDEICHLCKYLLSQNILELIENEGSR